MDLEMKPGIYLLAFVFFVLSLSTSFWWLQKESPPNVIHIVCELVGQRFYRDDSDFRSWLGSCYRLADRLRAHHSVEEVAASLQYIFDRLRVSHLRVIYPPENREYNLGERMSTGLLTRFIDGDLYVLRVERGSAAERAGVLPGDIVVSLNGKHPSESAIQWMSGEYQILRGEKELLLEIEASTLVGVDQPEVIWHGNQLAQLRIPTFRPYHFEEDRIDSLFDEQVMSAPYLVLDLRGNRGGNFGAMLRVLSRFVCEEQFVGSLQRTRFVERLGGDVQAVDFPDSLMERMQVELLSESPKVNLATFPRQSCYTGSLSVLIDGQTASVSEILTQALMEFGRAKSFGEASSGQVLLSIIYDLPELGEGFSLSIPEAEYISLQGQRLEGRGISPDRLLYYRAQDAKMGRDSWVRQIIEILGVSN